MGVDVVPTITSTMSDGSRIKENILRMHTQAHGTLDKEYWCPPQVIGAYGLKGMALFQYMLLHKCMHDGAVSGLLAHFLCIYCGIRGCHE